MDNLMRTFSENSERPSFLPMPQGRLVFMVEPNGFDVLDAINPHMKGADGLLHRIDKEKALVQWEALKAAYLAIGMNVTVLSARPDCPDMVFCANQTLPFFDREGLPAVILSNMADDRRNLEVDDLRVQLNARGLRTYSLPDRQRATLFEGMGDALWVPGRRLICGGHGYRTHASIYQAIETLTETPVILFELQNPKFYHLDTCLSLLDAQTALACREGFTASGWTMLERLFPRLIEVPLNEADAPGFACNAHCPDQKHVLIQRGNALTCKALEAHGFTPIELDTSEFIKSGGSIFCMKMQCHWDSWPVNQLVI